VFFALVAAGLIYVIKKGAFDWSTRARREAEAEARLLDRRVARGSAKVSKAA
jgi:hypothetical protein